MIIQVKLKNSRTGENKEICIDDATSPSTGYTQAYANKVGEDYAKYRAPEQLNSPLHLDDKWCFVRASYNRNAHYYR